MTVSPRFSGENALDGGADPSLPAFTHGFVVFSDRTQIWWLRGLRRGFRHCFAVLRYESCWVICDPMCHRTDLTLLPPVDPESLVRGYRLLGFRVVSVMPHQTRPRVAPLRPMTCVEVVKRLLGLRAPRVLTPRQLHAHLVRENQPRKKWLTN